MKQKSKLLTAVWMAALTFEPLTLMAADKKKSAPPSASHTPEASPVASPAKSPANPIPFHGMVAAVDENAKTFTISGKTATRVFKITEKTEIIKGAAAGTMNDIVANEEVSGSYWKAADGSLEAKKVIIGKAASSEKKAKKTKSESSPASPETSPKS